MEENTNEEKKTEEVLESEKKSKSKKESFIELLKFVGFSISAGVIQILSFELLYDVINWKSWWACYLISIVLSVIWNFTFNRKFTFKSANNVPFAMVLVTIYYCAFIPVSVFGGNALEGIGWNGTLVTAIMMLLNFATEFLWDKFVVFNDPLTNKMLSKLKLKKKDKED
jgi:putative flippase GtrA